MSKDAAREFLKNSAETLADEDVLDAVTSALIHHRDEEIIGWVICLLGAFHELRGEISLWQPMAAEEKENARWMLSEFATRVEPVLPPVLMRQIKACEHESHLDWLGDLLHSIHDLHEEIAAWGEREAAVS